MGKKSELKLAREKVNEALKKVNDKIEELGAQTSNLYENLNRMQALFDHIRNMPIEQKLKYEKLKTIRLSWKNQADKIESDYEAAFKGGIKKGAAGASAVSLWLPLAQQPPWGWLPLSVWHLPARLSLPSVALQPLMRRWHGWVVEHSLPEVAA